jgi:hypothetical protein
MLTISVDTISEYDCRELLINEIKPKFMLKSVIYNYWIYKVQDCITNYKGAAEYILIIYNHISNNLVEYKLFEDASTAEEYFQSVLHEQF